MDDLRKVTADGPDPPVSLFSFSVCFLLVSFFKGYYSVLAGGAPGPIIGGAFLVRHKFIYLMSASKIFSV